jgi:hypothetical protein
LANDAADSLLRVFPFHFAKLQGDVVNQKHPLGPLDMQIDVNRHVELSRNGEIANFELIPCREIWRATRYSALLLGRQSAEMRRLKVGVLRQNVWIRYNLIAELRDQLSVRRPCKVLEAHLKGFHVWRLNPERKRDLRTLITSSSCTSGSTAIDASAGPGKPVTDPASCAVAAHPCRRGNTHHNVRTQRSLACETA